MRLSHRNLASNARAIAEYLALTPDDRGITSLPLHYCYGLSVLHSHLAAGAGVVMTSASVVDPCFAAALRDGGVTNIAGVPHTYDAPRPGRTRPRARADPAVHDPGRRADGRPSGSARGSIARTSGASSCS